MNVLVQTMNSKFPENEADWRLKAMGHISVYTKKAWEQGMIRPFLLLVSMTPMQRLEIAGSLGWCIVTEKNFKVPLTQQDELEYIHREAWNIINRRIMEMIY